MVMWKLSDLQNKEVPKICIKNKWVIARPENYKKKNLTFLQRINRAWLVFICKADCFMWPEDIGTINNIKKK